MLHDATHRKRPPARASLAEVSHERRRLMESLNGRVAIVTGASRGIGGSIARALADAGVRLGLGSRSGDNLGIEGSVARVVDVRNPASLEALVAGTVDRFGGLDILVVNAGVGAYGPFLELPADQLEEMIDVNVKGAIYSVRAALPELLKSEHADIVTIASEAGRRGLPYEACGARTSARGAWPPISPWAAGGQRTCRSWPG